MSRAPVNRPKKWLKSSSSLFPMQHLFEEGASTSLCGNQGRSFHWTDAGPYDGLNDPCELCHNISCEASNAYVAWHEKNHPESVAKEHRYTFITERQARDYGVFQFSELEELYAAEEAAYAICSEFVAMMESTVGGLTTTEIEQLLAESRAIFRVKHEAERALMDAIRAKRADARFRDSSLLMGAVLVIVSAIITVLLIGGCK